MKEEEKKRRKEEKDLFFIWLAQRKKFEAKPSRPRGYIVHWRESQGDARPAHGRSMRM